MFCHCCCGSSQEILRGYILYLLFYFALLSHADKICRKANDARTTIRYNHIHWGLRHIQACFYKACKPVLYQQAGPNAVASDLYLFGEIAVC